MIRARHFKRGRRAVGFLFFVLIMLPVLMASLGLSADVGRLIIAHRQAVDTADNVSMAAAHQFVNSGTTASAQIDSRNAERAARQTFAVARRAGMMPALERPRLSEVVVENGTSVKTAVTYRMTGFVVMDYLMGQRNNLSFTVERAAQICSETNCGYPVYGG